MGHFEYKVIPAPRSGTRAKGVKGHAGRFAGALENAINELAAAGWEYIRAESLPVDERHGISMRKTEIYQNVLVFRRPIDVTEDTPPVTVLIEDQTEDLPESDDLFEDINDDLPEEDTGEDVIEGTPEEEEAKT